MVQENEKIIDETNYASMLNDGLKQKDAYYGQKLEAKDRTIKELTDKIVNGQPSVIEIEGIKAGPDINQLRKELFKEDLQLSNRASWEKALELRDALIEMGEEDPFLPFGHDIIPTDTERMQAERVAKGIKEILEIADGNDAVFLNEWARRVK